MEIIQEKVKCDKTLQLIRKSLTAGYIDPTTGDRIKSDIGTPQGSVLSPLLANIVLDKFDTYIEKLKSKFETGKKRSRNKEYDSLTSKLQ